ncbi:MAG: Bifunctional protein HldE [Chlamydiales bacterium]|nr:Bifunctional protein HldE [Chlamydiales bacterium]MCH9619487.1 Bifunctional protein HldE [Chlamydiales bacterium]MCH9622291.1 Bifunctional protein HldE [Chlamydiales bacterium]
MTVEAMLEYESKIKTAKELSLLLSNRPKEEKVIMCHGVFDVVHPGHIRHLLYAKKNGATLIVSLTADKHITKGNVRPHVPEKLRALNLAVFEFVDYVVIDQEATPINNLRIIKPDYYAKGYEYIESGSNPKTTEEIEVLEEYGGEILFSPGDVVYSSSKFIELSPPKLGEDKLALMMNAEGISFEDLRKAVHDLRGIKVHVVGDTIVDTYTHCSMIGGMTKTPTMSLQYGRREDFTGGAAVVAKHLKAAGADVHFSTILGEDALKENVLDDLKQCGVRCMPIVDPLRPTTNKNTFVVGNYRVLKVDTLDNRSISDKTLEQLKQAIDQTEVDGVVFSDFRHGIFNSKTIEPLTEAIPKEVYCVADSQVASRWGNILDFKGFDLITPNEKEARFALCDQDSVIRHLGDNLFKASKAKTLFLKLGPKGLIVFRKDTASPASFFFDSFTHNAVDPVGAGDALLAYATLSMITTKNEMISAILGNIAASVECEHHGNIPVLSRDILDRIDQIEKRVNYLP